MTYITFITHAEYILLFLLISMIYIACIAHNHSYVFSYSYELLGFVLFKLRLCLLLLKLLLFLISFVSLVVLTASITLRCFLPSWFHIASVAPPLESSLLRASMHLNALVPAARERLRADQLALQAGAYPADTHLISHFYFIHLRRPPLRLFGTGYTCEQLSRK